MLVWSFICPFIHSFILFLLFLVGLGVARVQTFPILSHRFQLLLGNPQMFPSQLQDIIIWVGLGSALDSPTSGTSMRCQTISNPNEKYTAKIRVSRTHLWSQAWGLQAIIGCLLVRIWWPGHSHNLVRLRTNGDVAPTCGITTCKMKRGGRCTAIWVAGKWWTILGD